MNKFGIYFIVTIFAIIALSRIHSNQSRLPGTGVNEIDFTIIDHENKSVSLSDFRGKAVLLNFWATWCGYCRKERTELNYLHKKYSDRGLVILSVAGDSSIERVREYLLENPVEYHVLWDSDGTVSESYNVRGLPTNFLIDREGRILKKFVGYRNWTDPVSDEEIQALIEW